MRGRDVIEFLGLWEELHNSDFKHIEFEGGKNSAGANAFTIFSKKWIEKITVIVIISRVGRYGGIFAQYCFIWENSKIFLRKTIAKRETPMLGYYLIV